MWITQNSRLLKFINMDKISFLNTVFLILSLKYELEPCTYTLIMLKGFLHLPPTVAYLCVLIFLHMLNILKPRKLYTEVLIWNQIITYITLYL